MDQGGVVVLNDVNRERLMTYSEAARYLAVGRSTLYDLVGRGELPVVRMGPRCVRLRRQDLDQFVEARMSRRPQ